MPGASLFHEAAQPKRLRDDPDTAPTQERMGPQRAQRRNPSTDQKKARVQMARQSTQESAMTQTTTEAEYLQRIASATTLVEQRALAAELAALREAKTATLRSEAAYGSVAQASARVLAATPPAFARHSIASDWLAEAATLEVDPRAVESAMRAEASLWWADRPDAVKADPEEVAVQARGFAARTASQYGDAAPGAQAAFLAQVAHLSKVADVTQDVSTTHPEPGVTEPKGKPNPETFDDPILSAPGGGDTKTQPGGSPSLSEGDSPQSEDATQGIENPGNGSKNDEANGEHSYTDPLTSGGTPNSGGSGAKPPYKKGSAHTADDQTSTQADDAVPSTDEGDAPEGDHPEPAVQPPLGTGYDRSRGSGATVDSIDGTPYPKHSSLRAIAAAIPVEPASQPFVQAMGSLDSVDGSVAGIGGREIVGYVLATADLTEAQRSALEAHLSTTAADNYTPCPNHPGHSYNTSTGDCSCGSNHKRWANSNNPGGQKTSAVVPPFSAEAAGYAGGSPKSGDTATCHKGDGAIQFFDGQWMHLRGGGSHNDVYPATPKEQADKAQKGVANPRRTQVATRRTAAAKGSFEDGYDIGYGEHPYSDLDALLKHQNSDYPGIRKEPQEFWDGVKAGWEDAEAGKPALHALPLEESKRYASRRTAGLTCSVCGDAIAKDPNDGWHHDNGEKHDHEAKPGGGSKTAGEVPPEFKEHQFGKGDEDDEDDDEKPKKRDTSSDTSPSPDSQAGGGAGFRPMGAKGDEDRDEPKTRAERADEEPFEKDPGDQQDDWYHGDYEASLSLDPAFASRVQASLKTALPSYHEFH